MTLSFIQKVVFENKLFEEKNFFASSPLDNCMGGRFMVYVCLQEGAYYASYVLHFIWKVLSDIYIDIRIV